MLKLDKQRIEVYDNDPVHLTIELTSNQAGEGIYRLFPSTDDVLKLTIYKKKAVVPHPITGEEIIVDIIQETDEDQYQFYIETEDGDRISYYAEEPITPYIETVGEYYADMSDPRNLVIDIVHTEDIPEGSYWFDITYFINADSETYHVAKRQEILFQRR